MLGFHMFSNARVVKSIALPQRLQARAPDDCKNGMPAFARNVHRIERAPVWMGEHSRGACFPRAQYALGIEFGAAPTGRRNVNSAVAGVMRPNVHGEGRAPLLRASLSNVWLGCRPHALCDCEFLRA